MPNDYSVQLHDFITEKINSASQQLAEAENSGDTEKQSYWRGQLEEFSWVRSYLKSHIDLKDFIYYQQST